MSRTILVAALLFAPALADAEKEVTDAEKKEFLKLLSKLPTEGEFFTDEGVKTAIPHVRVLLALTEKDLENRALYPLLALSRGLADQKESRQYAMKNFSKIAHPTLKLGWATMLLDEKAPSAEIVAYLRRALDTKQDARTLASMLGPGFEKFKDRVIRLDEAGKQQTLRDQVLKADTAASAGKAFEEYFQHLGAAGIRDLLTDKDTGIALQADWEVHKKAIKRPTPIVGRADDIYDRDELKKFLAFLKERTKAPIPDWWAAGITEIDLFPGRHLASGEATRNRPKFKKSKSGKFVPEGANLELVDGTFRYSVGGRTVEFPEATFDNLGECLTGLLGDKRSVVAAFSDAGGFGYKLAGLEGKGGKPTWKTDVWAAGRTMLGGYAAHRMELQEKDGVVYVFGAESHGMYLEAFDGATGKCLFRFCNGYWFHFSEAWGQK